LPNLRQKHRVANAQNAQQKHVAHRMNAL